MSSPPTARGHGLASLWLLAGALAWACVPVILGAGPALRTYRELAAEFPAYLLLGLFVGAATGLGQALARRLPGISAWRWLWASAVGYGLAFPGGVIIGTLILSVSWRLSVGTFLFMPLSEPGTVTYWTFPGDLAYAGFLAGLCQWAALRSSFVRPTRAMQALWVFGAWLGIGLGLFAGGIITGRLMPAGALPGLPAVIYRVLWGILWGVTTGGVSAVVLWILRRESQRRTLPAFGRADA